jgi:hypothetical protein
MPNRIFYPCPCIFFKHVHQLTPAGFFPTGSAPGSQVDRASGEVHPRTGPGLREIPPKEMEKLLEKYGKLIFFQARCAKNGGFTRYSIESPVYEYYI